MIPARSFPGRILLSALVFAAWATGAFAGSNEGFTVSLSGPAELRNPQIGQTINLTVYVQGTKLVKGNVVKISYDSTYFSFLSYNPGNITSGVLIPLNLPPTLVNGLYQVECGSTLFSNAQAKSGGTLGTFSFQVIAQPPVEGTYISVAEVEVNASSSDKDILEYGLNAFGIKALYVFPNGLFDFSVERFHDRAVVIWTSRNRGFDDLVEYRPVGTSEWLSATNPLKTRFAPNVVEAVKTLRVANVDPVLADSLTIARPGQHSDGSWLPLCPAGAGQGSRHQGSPRPPDRAEGQYPIRIPGLFRGFAGAAKRRHSRHVPHPRPA